MAAPGMVKKSWIVLLNSYSTNANIFYSKFRTWLAL